MLAPQGRRLCRAGHGEAPGSSGPVTGASFFTVTLTPSTPPSLAAERQHTWASRRGRLGGRAVGPVWGARAGGGPVHAVEQSNARSVPRRVTRHTVRPHAHASGPPQPAGSQAPERGATGPGRGPRGPQLMRAAAAGTNLGPRAPGRAQGRQAGLRQRGAERGQQASSGGGGSRGGGPPPPCRLLGQGPSRQARTRWKALRSHLGRAPPPSTPGRDAVLRHRGGQEGVGGPAGQDSVESAGS